MREPPQEVGDQPGEQRLQLCIARRRHRGETNALADRFVHAIVHQHVQMHIEVGGAAVTLNEGNYTCPRLSRRPNKSSARPR